MIQLKSGLLADYFAATVVNNGAALSFNSETTGNHSGESWRKKQRKLIPVLYLM